MDLPTLKYLDLSTGHITAEDNEMLASREWPDDVSLVVYENEYGYFIPIYDTMDWVALKQAGFSSAFAELIDMCQEQKIHLIRLDRDAPEIEGLQTFEW